MEILAPFVKAGVHAAELGQKIEKNPHHKRALAAIIGTLLAVNSLMLKDVNEDAAVAAQAVECTTPICINPSTGQAVINPDFTSSGAFESPETKKKKSKEKTEFVLPEEYRTTERRIDAMNLSTEGYLDFLTKIDTSFLSYAQKHNSFNYKRVKVEQGKTRTIVEHFTAFEQDKRFRRPDGKMNVRRFIKGMNKRDGTADGCCGAQWLIDKTGTVYQLAPLNAKLAHAYPFNEYTTGIEVEATYQADVTTKQHEQLTYLEIYLLQAFDLLDPNKLDKTIRGHGEMSDEIIKQWNATHPRSQWMEVRNDFNAPVARYRRAKLKRFILQNPGLDLLKPDLPKI